MKSNNMMTIDPNLTMGWKRWATLLVVSIVVFWIGAGLGQHKLPAGGSKDTASHANVDGIKRESEGRLQFQSPTSTPGPFDDVDFLRPTPYHEFSPFNTIGDYVSWAGYVAKVSVSQVLDPILVRTSSSVPGDASEGFVAGAPSDEDGQTGYFRVFTPILMDVETNYKSPDAPPNGLIVMTEGGRSGRFAEANEFNPVNWQVGDVGIVFLSTYEFDYSVENALASALASLRAEYSGLPISDFVSYFRIVSDENNEEIIIPSQHSVLTLSSTISASDFIAQIEAAAN